MRQVLISLIVLAEKVRVVYWHFCSVVAKKLSANIPIEFPLFSFLIRKQRIKINSLGEFLKVVLFARIQH